MFYDNFFSDLEETSEIDEENDGADRKPLVRINLHALHPWLHVLHDANLEQSAPTMEALAHYLFYVDYLIRMLEVDGAGRAPLFA